MQLEKDIENKFVEWVKNKGGLIYKWEGSRKKIDRIVVTGTGQVLFIEFKRPGGKLSPHQKKIIGELEYHNANVLVTDNVKDAMDFYRRHSA